VTRVPPLILSADVHDQGFRSLRLSASTTAWPVVPCSLKPTANCISAAPLSQPSACQERACILCEYRSITSLRRTPLAVKIHVTDFVRWWFVERRKAWSPVLVRGGGLGLKREAGYLITSATLRSLGLTSTIASAVT